MRLEPAIDKAGLCACIAGLYGIQLAHVTYIPVGEASYSYLGETAAGARYVVKVMDRARLARTSAQHMATALPLLAELRSRQLLMCVPRPLLAHSGQAVMPCGDYDVALLEYVAGENPDDAMYYSPDVWSQLARGVAGLHRATDQVEAVCPYVETFDIPFEQDLRDGMADLVAVTGDSPEGHRAMAALLMPRLQTLEHFIRRLHELATIARAFASPKVLCHTDIHRWNTLIDDEGVVTILDWEGLKVAPAEHDLFAFNGESFPAFLQTYLDAGGVRELHAATFGFYFYRRNLEDLTDYIVRVLHENDDEQSAMDVAAMQSECLDVWPYLEPSIALVEAQLASL